MTVGITNHETACETHSWIAKNHKTGGDEAGLGPAQPDGSLSNEEVFFDATSEPGEDAWYGLKVDVRGNTPGPGGLWIISPEGRHLGTISGPEHPHNLAWGDADGKTLYLAAQSGLYRTRVSIAGTATPDGKVEASSRTTK